MKALRQRQRDESGFALMAVLAVIALTGIVFGVLVGLMALTLKITANHERTERERRASDGAIVATLNHLRLGALGAGCSSIASTLPGFELPFDVPSGSDKVNVTCEAAADDYGDPAGEVKLVGDSYAGTITDWRTAWPWASVSGASAALATSGVNPSLVHSGSEPLRFNGHVNSASGAAPLRNPVSGSPALEVRGEYRQGKSGLGATGTDCGLLRTPGSPLFIDAVAGASCGDPSALSAAVPSDYAIDQTLATLPSESGGCPAGPVVTFSAGRYDQRAVKTLNRWFNGSCSNRTFYFPTGVYWFDANDASKPAADRNALVIDDAGSRFVFGEPKGWSTSTGATAANFPAACNAGVSATSPGASIVLSGRTSLRHLAGRLAVCPFVSPAGEPYPAILQQRSQPNDVTVTPGALLDFAPVANLISGDSSQSAGPATFSCVMPVGWESECTAQRRFEVKLVSSASAEPLRSVRVGLTGDEPNYPVSVVQSRRVEFLVTLADASTCTTSNLDGGIDDGTETSFELLTGTCATKLTSSSQLDGATVRSTVSYRYAAPCLDFGGCGFGGQTLVIWDVGVTVDTFTSSATSVGAVSGWSNVANALADDSTAGVLFNSICGQPVCGGPVPDMTFERSFTLTNVSLAAPLDPTDSLSSIGVVIKQKGDQAQGINSSTLSGQTSLKLTLSDGSVCEKTFPGVVNRTGSTYYPMLSLGSSQCGAVSWAPTHQIASLLSGASVSVSVQLNCLWPVGDECGGFLLPSYVQPVAIQYVGLMATTDSYKGPVTKSQIRVDSTASGSGSSANFFGSAMLPHTSLDIFWSGKSSKMSLFGGELQLWSLGSRMSAGAEADVVCCTKPEVTSHKVRLTAYVGGRPVLSAVAILAPDRSRPEVLEWTQCGRNGACGTP
ncbi:MAG: hypothetical protein KDB26_04775 [Microthrixaceae bacterium]|nr:hypothetical protein [Microthrixaceae bacterium]